jgi:hypothetical protein
MWLTACPAESEQPGTEINYFQEQLGIRIEHPAAETNQLTLV